MKCCVAMRPFCRTFPQKSTFGEQVLLLYIFHLSRLSHSRLASETSSHSLLNRFSLEIGPGGFPFLTMKLIHWFIQIASMINQNSENPVLMDSLRLGNSTRGNIEKGPVGGGCCGRVPPHRTLGTPHRISRPKQYSRMSLVVTACTTFVSGCVSVVFEYTEPHFPLETDQYTALHSRYRYDTIRYDEI